jgi:hypothetical protein
MKAYSFVLRALLFGALFLGSIAPSFAHEVLVYSYFTAAGRAVASPTIGRPAFCALATDPVNSFTAASAAPADPEFVRRAVRRALSANGYLPGDEAAAADVVLVYHWGVTRPTIIDAGTSAEQFVDRDQMLALLAGRARGELSLNQRAALEAAAREERVVLLVSAYDGRALREEGRHTLLWRTHMSVPNQHLSETQAVPILLAAGAGLFGRDTLGARVVSIGTSRALVAGW